MRHSVAMKRPLQRVDAWFLRFESPIVMLGLAILVAYGVWWARFDGKLHDFGSFVASGRAAAEGLNPYGAYPLTLHVWRHGQELINYNLNPPVVVMLFQAIGRIDDPWVAFQIWFVVQSVAYGATLLLLLRHYPRPHPGSWALWLLALGGIWDTLGLGQIYLPMALAATAGWICLDRSRPIAAGVLIGLLAAIKPNLVVWPGLLLLAGHWRPAASAFVTMAVLSLLPALVYGPEVYRAWVTLILSDANRIVFPTNMSLAGLAIRYGLPWLGPIASAVLLLAAATWAWRARPPALDVSAIGLVAALLASPIAWIHYALFLLPVLFYRRLNPLLRIAALLLALPVKIALIGDRGPVWLATLGSVFNYALILLLVGLAIAIAREPLARAACLTRGAPAAAPALAPLRRPQR